MPVALVDILRNSGKRIEIGFEYVFNNRYLEHEDLESVHQIAISLTQVVN